MVWYFQVKNTERHLAIDPWMGISGLIFRGEEHLQSLLTLEKLR